jgi:hypothetical protein
LRFSDRNRQRAANDFEHCLREADAAWFRVFLQPRGNVHAVTQRVAIGKHDVAQMNTNSVPEFP